MASKSANAQMDECALGHWVSGFVCGEGCFTVNVYRNPETGGAINTLFGFGVSQRSDNVAALKLVKKAFGSTGKIRRPTTPTETYRRTGKTISQLKISDIRTLHDIVVPFFEKYPLRAKKRREFLVFRKAVRLAYKVQDRPKLKFGKLRGTSRWKVEERELLFRLAAKLKEVRAWRKPKR